MSLNTAKISGRHKKGFTIVELMVSSLVIVYIFLCALAMYMMGLAWWNEILPQTECQRIARSAISTIKEGMIDSTVGTDIINSVTYKKRNGLEEAYKSRDDSLDVSFTTPLISLEGRKISFKLEPDPTSTNSRAFYLGQDASGTQAVYYQVGSTTPKLIRATRGITDLVFEAVSGYTNTIKVTATVQKTVMGSRSTPYQISVVYSDYVYLRNM